MWHTIKKGSVYPSCSSQSHLRQNPGGNFTNILYAAITRTDPKRIKKTYSLTVFFALFGSEGVKASQKMLVKSAPGTQSMIKSWRAESWGQFHQCSTYSFYAHSSPKHKNSVKLSVSFYAFGIYTLKSCT